MTASGCGPPRTRGEPALSGREGLPWTPSSERLEGASASARCLLSPRDNPPTSRCPAEGARLMVWESETERRTAHPHQAREAVRDTQLRCLDPGAARAGYHGPCSRGVVRMVAVAVPAFRGAAL